METEYVFSHQRQLLVKIDFGNKPTDFRSFDVRDIQKRLSNAGLSICLKVVNCKSCDWEMRATDLTPSMVSCVGTAAMLILLEDQNESDTGHSGFLFRFHKCRRAHFLCSNLRSGIGLFVSVQKWFREEMQVNISIISGILPSGRHFMAGSVLNYKIGYRDDVLKNIVELCMRLQQELRLISVIFTSRSKQQWISRFKSEPEFNVGSKPCISYYSSVNSHSFRVVMDLVSAKIDVDCAYSDVLASIAVLLTADG